MTDKITIGRCKDCKHWLLGKDDEYNRLIFPHNPLRDMEQCESEDEAAALFGHKVRRCRSQKLLFYSRPDADGAAVMDGSEYRAELITGEGYGCVNWTAKG